MIEQSAGGPGPGPIRNANPLQPREAVILSVRREAEEVLTYTMAFTDPEARRRYTFIPGQFNMISIWGVEEAPLSLCSAPRPDGSFDHTVRGIGNLTRALLCLREGDKVGARGPYGVGWPMEAARGRDLLIVGGGLGMATLRSAVEAALAAPTAYRSLTIVYGARTPDNLLYTYDFDRWQAQTGGRLYLTVDRADGQTWQGRVGVVTTVLHEESLPYPEMVAFVVGPEVMMRFTVVELLSRGLQPENLYLSMERRMRCGVARCGHCFFGPKFVCRDGPVFQYPDIQHLLGRDV